MNRIFGKEIKGLEYKKRGGAYGVILTPEEDKVLTVRTARGHYFLPGGGIERNESHQECLQREVLEETGYQISLGHFIDNASRFFVTPDDEPLLSEGYFYLAELVKKVREPMEEDHIPKWIDINVAHELLIHEYHTWAVKEGSRIHHMF